VNVLAHRIDGSGAPLVLLNGGMMTISSWDEIARALAASFTVIRCDFRGQLRSPGPAPADLSGHCADLAVLLDHLGVERAHLVGTSFGGEVAIEFAATRPERTASLVAATVTDVASPEFRAGGARLRQACAAVVAGGDARMLWDTMTPVFYSPEWLGRHKAELAIRREQFVTFPTALFDGIVALLVALDSLDLTALLPRIVCPTLIVMAGEDRVMAPEGGRALVAGIRGARIAVVEGSGHALVAEQPGRFSALCLEFITDVLATTRSGRES